MRRLQPTTNDVVVLNVVDCAVAADSAGRRGTGNNPIIRPRTQQTLTHKYTLNAAKLKQ